ncbi:DNA damage-inducible protein D [Lysobacter sp. A6]|uniref:DNA damage-inducible protein D n=1 Tax=Noviluteimonas lactosilytica TaxID=2888523 RepID=A0ABS8JGW4_9GAMM|nr:DNA damage-inducible protein D [Lysobacter lactosilyticus]MCC8362827.1 DNA damage-inducible protein D [Lysobacter lactosilyticus]
MKKELIASLHRNFEEAVHVEGDVEYWLARELQSLLGYSQWRNFERALDDARTACKATGGCVEDHFADASKMVDLGSGAARQVRDIALTRYACYLIAQNGDPRKPEIAFAMNYFAVQTRKQEIVEKRIAEFERVQARSQLSLSQKALSSALFERGIDSTGFGRILSKGDQALFGGSNTQDMKDRLGVPDSRPLADFLPTITIKAKDFANEVTHMQVKQQDLRGEPDITTEHVRNNEDVRRILTDRNIRPEALPPGEDVRRVERRLKAEEKQLPRSGRDRR